MNIEEISIYVNLDKKIITDIQHYYNEPHRFYHSWNHIIQGFKEFRELEKQNIFKITQDMKIAWLFHDSVYLPFSTGTTNEELSIKLMEFYNSTKIKLPLELIEESKKLIKATEKHNAFDEKSAIFLDVDMAYLGSDYNTFLNIRKKVRQEYIMYNDVDFAKGTIQFYLSMLQKEKIYQSEYGLLKYENNARINMLEDLTNQKNILNSNKLKFKV